ncbi:MAG: hypothetical protein JXR71_05090 [Bacteroidales bacterium]|nr:hypothetical protein [Bacteroidales bacterium]
MDPHKHNEEDNLYRIKEILFGEDLQTVNQRFADLKTEWEESLSTLKAATDGHLQNIQSFQENQTQHLEKIQQQFQEKLEAVRVEISAQVEGLERHIKQHETSISEALDSLNEKQVSRTELAELLKGIIEKLQ